MRILLPTSILLFGFSHALSQPIITTASLPRAVFMDTMPKIYYNSQVSPGIAGTNAVWDFTYLPTNPPYPDTIIHAPCPGGPGCTGFASANLVSATYGRDTSYFNSTAGVFSLVGYASYGVIAYSNPMDLIRVPMTYNSTFTDSFTATYTIAPNTAPYYQSGTVSVVADSWGTLMLPSGTIGPVLRLKRTVVAADSLGGLPGSVTSQVEVYQWYSPVVRGYLLELTLSQSGTAVSYQSKVPAITNVADSQPVYTAIRITPNPATDRIVVTSGDAAPADVLLCDLTGRVLLRTTVSGETTLAVDALPRGLYLLRVHDATGAMHSEKVTLR